MVGLRLALGCSRRGRMISIHFPRGRTQIDTRTLPSPQHLVISTRCSFLCSTWVDHLTLFLLPLTPYIPCGKVTGHFQYLTSHLKNQSPGPASWPRMILPTKHIRYMKKCSHNGLSLSSIARKRYRHPCILPMYSLYSSRTPRTLTRQSTPLPD